MGSDDGARVFLNNSPTPTVNAWGDHGASPIVYGPSGTVINAGSSVPITVEYYENSGNAQMALYMKQASLPGAPDMTVDSNWLSPQVQVLPQGWNLGLDADGTISYSFAAINPGGVTLYDSAGQTYEYKFINGGFVPPVNESGQMIRNGDGTITLQDEDGQTYIFNSDGTIKSVTRPADDRNPAALKYTYGSSSGSAARITQITDGVDSSRWLKVLYGGDSACPAAPSGFLAASATSMICGATSSDSRTTGIFYVNDANSVPRLARITMPGNEFTDYAYQSGLLSQVRGSLANDAIAAGVRTQDGTELTSVAYDGLGRAASVTLPAATAGATRLAHTYKYLPGNTSQMHVTNATEPNGFSRKVTYDGTYRTLTDTDIANLSVTTVWDPVKDLVKSITDPAGLKSTSLYDYADRETDDYGPAPSAWFGTDNKPLTAPTDYTSQIPRTQTTFEEGINGLAAAYYDVTTASNGTGVNTKVLFGNPKSHTTGVGPASGDILKTWGGSPPITPAANNGWGTSLTGWIHLTAGGNHTFRAFSDDGVRVWIDDNLLINDWVDGAQRPHPANTSANGVFNNTSNPADSWHRLRVDYYNKSVGSVLDTDARLELYMTPPGGTETSALGSLLKPNYVLATTQKTFDSSTSVGDSITTSNYGANPELSLVQSTTLDPSGLGLTTGSTYETQGASGSYLRQTSKTLPGGGTTNYTYYNGTETRQNPCDTTKTYKQAGMMKLKTEADPDAGGPQTGRVSESVYDDAGRVVANRLNADSWTCTTHDARGRVTQTVIPPNSVGAAGRTINNNWAVNGNPLITSSSDPTNVETTVDLLGRVVGYRDSMSYTFVTGQTVTSYDTIGRLVSRSSPKLGLEEFTYDNFNRLVSHKLDGTVYATTAYDAFSRLQQVTYPTAGQQKLVIGRDTLGRTNAMTYTLGSGGAGPSDTVTRSQSGQVVSGTELSQSKTYTYDKARRLTAATFGTNTYAYNFVAPTACTGTYNINSGKNANRTSQTVNGATTTYCYDNADRLVSSSDQSLTTPGYDAHGNTTSFGTTYHLDGLQFAYDASDRTSLVREYFGSDANIQYYRDVADRIYYRGASGSSIPYTDTYLGYTSSSDSPDFLLNSSTNVIEKYLSLPGGVLLTIRPNATPTNAQKTFSPH